MNIIKLDKPINYFAFISDDTEIQKYYISVSHNQKNIIIIVFQHTDKINIYSNNNFPSVFNYNVPILSICKKIS